MHIPTKESRNMKILTFEEAKSLRSESAGYDREKWVQIPDIYSDYRYVLGTVGKKPLITIGVNPSTAAPDALDNTLKSVNRIALGNGFDSFIMLNLYAQRATRPDDMDKVLNTKLHKENLEALRWVLEQCDRDPIIWAAWGTIIERRTYLKACLEDMIALGNEFHVTWCNAGKLSKKGHPHHPLFLKKDSKLTEFPMDNYLSSTY